MKEFLLANWIEISGVITSLICVWLNVRQNIWGWFWAMVSSVLSGILFWQSGLYSDAELQVFFFLMSAYGYWQWLRGGVDSSPLVVGNQPKKYWFLLAVLAVGFTAGSGYVHFRVTNAYLSYIDSAATAISLVAQWQMARKYLENWVLWATVNVVYVGLYLSKNLYGYAGLYVVFFLLAIHGYRSWKASR